MTPLLEDIGAATCIQGDLIVLMFLTVAPGNCTAAGLSAPAPLALGTLKLTLLIDEHPRSAALFYAVFTLSEAIAGVLVEEGIRPIGGGKRV